MSATLARALLAELDDAALDELAVLLVPRIEARLRRDPASGDGWLDAKAAAAYLGISRHALHRLTAERSVPFSQSVPGGRLYFRRSDLDDWRAETAR